MPMLPRDNFPIRGDSNDHGWFDSSRYSIVQRFFLTRLERMVALRRSPEPRTENWQTTLIDRAIYSSFRDCVALGLADEARTVLRGEERAPHSSASA
ncbi:MAG TPA: hypothetical protein VMW65_17870 [Chloroflexota bacterium]|nr:hypothetical protein [Chloroflexota bacterium]